MIYVFFYIFQSACLKRCTGASQNRCCAAAVDKDVMEDFPSMWLHKYLVF